MKKLVSLLVVVLLVSLFGTGGAVQAQDSYGPDITSSENGVAIANGDYANGSTGYVRANAFDNNLSTWWASPEINNDVISNSYIGFQFNTERHIRRIGLNQNATGGGVNSFKIQRLDQNSTWVDVQTISNITISHNTTQYFDIIASESSTSWRLVALSKPNGTDYAWNLSEVEMMEINAASRAILTITMTNGFEKEYDLSMAEVNTFIAWYDARDAGTGPVRFAFTKTWNNGPFKSRTEYVIFDKILTFEVNEYDLEQ